MTSDPGFVDRQIKAFLDRVISIDTTLASWSVDQEPYGMPGYRARSETDRQTYLAAATSWASR